ncbi:MAG: glycosyltransferase family 39 protein [Pyrinomonadaceae bacterium]
MPKDFQTLSANPANIVTAGLRPELFAEAGGAIFKNRQLLIALLALLVLAGFGFRVAGSSVESLGEDEFNKLNAVADYRAHGLTAANGEHPLLMKALQAVSIVAAEKWNASADVESRAANLHVPVEAALRFPSVLFGALTAVLIYLVTAELFGTEAALLAAALWTFDPAAIGFNRIAKEDTFLLFFFLLANVFWLRGQRVAESQPQKNPEPYYWATGAAFGAMLASKYVPHFIVISISYNYAFQRMPETRWRIGRPRYAVIVATMGVVFLLCNPTILLPATWHEMRTFASFQRVGHDSYEFMGRLYNHRMTDWLRGIPVYFYFVFVGVKLPLLTLAAFLAGFPLLFRKRLGDGRYFLIFWMFYWALSFILPGGKFTRYFTSMLPAVLITASLGIQFVARIIAQRCAAFFASQRSALYARAILALLVITFSVRASLNAAPHYRLYMNLLGGGEAHAGDYFPHDEFYDASVSETMREIARRARPHARVASETPGLATFYAQQAGRADLQCVSLSDPAALEELGAGDYIVAARGRRYRSNDELLTRLRQSSAPSFRLPLGRVPSVEVYALDQTSLPLVAVDALK